MARLKKQHVEQLISTYDTDPQAALLGALRIVLEDPAIEWTDAVNALPHIWSSADIGGANIAALDRLLTHLVECRDLQQP
jgi:hypothetical protein